MQGLLEDLRFGARTLRRAPGTTAAAALTLSLGMAALTTIFSLLNGILLRPLPYPDSEDLVILYERSPIGERTLASRAALSDWQAASQSFAGIAAIESANMNLAGIAEPERITVKTVSPELFGLLGAAPYTGSAAIDSKTELVLTEPLWERRFGRDPGVVGRAITLDGNRVVVAGILPRGFRFFQKADAFLLARAAPIETDRNARRSLIVARLAPGVSLQRAQAELQGIAGNVARAHPASNRGWSVEIASLQETLVRGPQQDLPILFCAAAFVLFIACANVAGLALAKSAARRQEFSIRASLGAGRLQLFRLMVVENVLLALLAGGAGLAISSASLEWIRKQIPLGVVPNPDAAAIDGRVFAFVILVCLLTGIVCALAPAWRCLREDLAGNLGRSDLGRPGTSRLRSILATVEIAAALVLLSGAGLMFRALSNVGRFTEGRPPQEILTLRMSLPRPRYEDPQAALAFLRGALESVRALPAVEGCALVTALPFEGSASVRSFSFPENLSGEKSAAVFNAVTEGFLASAGIRVERGSSFENAGKQAAAFPAVVNPAFARRFFPGTDPFGRRLLIDGTSTTVEIVGVTAERQSSSRLGAEPPQVFIPFDQHPSREAALVVFAPSPAIPALKNAVAKAIRQLDRDLPVSNVMTLAELRDRHLSVPTVLAGLVGAFGVAAFFLSLIGIIGLVSHAAAERTREIGIRAALGAGKVDILRLIGRQGMRYAAAGLILGLAGTAALSRILRGILFGVPLEDWASIAATAVVLFAGTLAACYGPALRAASLDPAEALRHD